MKQVIGSLHARRAAAPAMACHLATGWCSSARALASLPLLQGKGCILGHDPRASHAVEVGDIGWAALTCN